MREKMLAVIVIVILPLLVLFVIKYEYKNTCHTPKPGVIEKLFVNQCSPKVKHYD